MYYEVLRTLKQIIQCDHAKHSRGNVRKYTPIIYSINRRMRDNYQHRHFNCHIQLLCISSGVYAWRLVCCCVASVKSFYARPNAAGPRAIP